MGDLQEGPEPASGSQPVPPAPVVPAPTRGRVMSPEDLWLSEWLQAEGVVLPPAVRAAHRDWLRTFE